MHRGRIPAKPFHLTFELERYRSHNPQDADTADLFLDFVRSTPDHLIREHLAGHLTGSAFVVDEAGRETVLVHHRKLGLWVQPGGHADGNADLRAVAQQELNEETGLAAHTISPGVFDLDRHTIPARGDIPQHYHYDVRFLFRAVRHQPLVISHESIDLRWFSLESIVNGELAARGIETDDSVRRMAWKALAVAGRSAARKQL